MNSTRFNKNIFNDPKCPLEKFMILSKVKTSAKSHAHISRPFWISELNHMLFEFGHLNASKYFKSPNNPKLKCSMLDIFYTVGMYSLVIFERV